MGVITTFGEKRDEAKDGLAKAINALQVCVNENTYGYEEVRKDYIIKLAKMIPQLIEMKIEL